MSYWWLQLKKSTVLPWAILFIFSNLLVTQLSNTNARSRIASLRAITEGHTLDINNYKDWTMDWSQSPNGKIYSNKAPGGMLIGLPIFWATDLIASGFYHGSLDEKSRRPEPGYLQLIILVLFTQILPFAALVVFIANKLAAWGYSRATQHYFALAALFGNTAAIYMNTYFGHGLAALLFLGFAICWIERNYALASFWFSFAILTDYVGIAILPAFVLGTVLRERSLKPALPCMGGAIPGALLWIGYHLAAFGSPFAIATQFNNPALMEEVVNRSNLWGGFTFLPSLNILYELLIGPSRGLLFTQPWLLLTVILVPNFFAGGSRRNGNKPHFALMLMLGLMGLLWINAGYGVWHGGWCAGPRYLSMIFPAFALLAAILLEKLPHFRAPFWVALAAALCFRILIFPHSDLAPASPLWIYYFEQYFNGHLGTSLVRLFLLLLGILGALFWVRRQSNQQSRK